MKQHDILIAVNGKLEWICGMFNDTVNQAITCAISEAREYSTAKVKTVEYVGHKSFVVVNGKWEEASQAA